MRLTIFIYFVYASINGQEIETTTTIKKEKLEVEKSLFQSNRSKESFDAMYRKALNEQEKLNGQKGTLDVLVKQELLNENSQDLPQEPDQQQELDSDQDGTPDVVVKYNSNEMLKRTIASVLESEIESAIESEIESDVEPSKKRLYGPSQFDSRIELLQLDQNVDWQLKLLINSESVGLIIEKEYLSQLAKETYILDTSKLLGKVYGLCPDEAFYNQPVAGIGTAFIISNNTMITANHVFERPITDYIVVFGYKVLVAKTGVTDYYFDKNDIYFPQSVEKQSVELDVTEFKVDRNFDKPVLEWENSQQIYTAENGIYMIGHPSGLPIKVALNAAIEDNTHPHYYFTSLDSFQGNSGSPVFNFNTNKVIGILVSGEVDYKFNGNCYYSAVCKVPYCKGEKVIRIESFMEN